MLCLYPIPGIKRRRLNTLHIRVSTARLTQAQQALLPVSVTFFKSV
ncbi:hypothetical protein HMPREF0880_01075 [Yokenella regensburgei ATCC 43003]|nr:hypothetical protein HMPREF0880_01075 [Yokenella regensburgei ATCC 43003]